jgi:hypothetical protein
MIKSEKEYISLTDLNNLCPDMFPKQTTINLLRNRHKNGFNSCLRKVGHKFYIDVKALNDWIVDKEN